jgi:uncharacterized membrane protein YhaH (DUF805 family)
MNWQWFLFSFKGRISRKPFWIFNLTVSLLWLITMLLSGTDLRHFTKEPTSIVFDIVILWPALSVQAKRWHDLNKSAWHILVILIPLIGPIWALVQTGFIPGTPGLNRYGSSQLEEIEDKTKKVFISGESTPYFMEIMVFIVLPIGALYILTGALMRDNWMVLFLIVPLFIFLFFFFKFLRNRRVFKIITTDVGIAFYGILKEIYSSWPEVKSVQITMGSLQDLIEVKTENGNFRFSLFMKNEAEEYPKLNSGLPVWKWKFANGTEKELTAENNPLYLEINSRLRQEQGKHNKSVHTDAE